MELPYTLLQYLNIYIIVEIPYISKEMYQLYAKIYYDFILIKSLYMFRCKYPNHVEAFYENKVIVNCCIKLVQFLTYIYDARSHLHQIPYILVTEYR